MKKNEAASKRDIAGSKSENETIKMTTKIDKNLGVSKIEPEKRAKPSTNKASSETEVETVEKQQRRETRPSEKAKETT